MAISRRAARAYPVYLAVGLFATLLVGLNFPLRGNPTPIWIVLPALALLAEFLPVRVSRRGLRITFTLPYVAGMAVATGPFGAILTDLVVTLLAGVALAKASQQKVSAMWVCLNLAIAAMASSAAAVIHSAVIATGDGQRGTATLAALLFAIVYGLTNFGLVVIWENRMAKGRTRDGETFTSISLFAQGLAVYAVMTVAVSILVHRSLVAFVPLTLLPILAVRTGLMIKARMYEHYYESIAALSAMLQRAHPYTHGHLERVAWLAGEAAILLGLSPRHARLVREASILHDIGKIAIDESILDKPSRLTESEYQHVKQHSQFGAAILSTVEPFREMVTWVRHHHERPDGTGYPDQLRDEEIPLESKIIAVADAYDAMTGTEIGVDRRSYREPMTQTEAIAELERCSGTQFDPRVVSVFKRLLLQEAELKWT